MKRTIFIILTLAFLALGSAVTNQVSAGIPTTDIAAISQRIMMYVQEIKEYQEMLKQSTKMTQQYIQLVRTYQQKIREYNHYLNQLKSLQYSIERKDWLYLMRFIRKHGFYGKGPLATRRDPDASDYEETLSDALSKYEYEPRKPADVEADARKLGIWSDAYSERTSKNWYNYQLHKERWRAVDENRKKDELLEKDVNEYADAVANLGDESDLATQQAIAVGNLTLMRQNRMLLERLNQMLMHMENRRAQEASRRAKIRDMEIERLNNLKTSPSLGRDGYFKK